MAAAQDRCPISAGRAYLGIGIAHLYAAEGAQVIVCGRRVDELTIEMWDGIFRSDLRGAFYITKCVPPHMRKGGSIINICSMASRTW